MESELPESSATVRKGIKFRRETWLARLTRFKKRVLFASSPSDSLLNRSNGSSTRDSSVRDKKEDKERAKKLQEIQREEDEIPWTVDQVVVESDFDRAPGSNYPHARFGGSLSHSEKDTSDPHRNTGIDPSELAESIMRSQTINSFKALFQVISSIFFHFFSSAFVEPQAEEQFQKERWYNTKLLAWLATAFMLLNWVLYLIFNHSASLFEKIAYYGVATFFTLPLPLLVGLDLPRKRPLFFQSWLMCATWFWAVSECMQMKICGFYSSHRQCGSKDFLFMMTYSVALPALVLFSFNQKRIFAAFGTIVQFILLCALILPDQTIFVRNVISYAVFSVFFICLHYYQEQIDRRMFILRAQLKISFKAQQKAITAEKTAANSKRRFVSYIFHEVRVPLNSALLAFQNLQSNAAFKHCEEEQGIEIHALEGSLIMMQQVLNDVLDLQRMDSGRFESSAVPFPFHRSLQSMLGTLRVATASKNLGLNIEFDQRIDQCGISSIDGPYGAWLIGDPMRLRQVISNLTSNAAKFTPPGNGAITVKTILVSPPFAHRPSSPPLDHKTVSLSSLEEGQPRLQSEKHPTISEDGQLDSVVVRIEVTDAGPGIRPSDLQEDRLFSPFVQTQLGVSQAGKGSGLGLAIVRQIVTLSGGRLGVSSRKDCGATFWVEFSFRLATGEDIGKHHGTNLPLPDILQEHEQNAIVQTENVSQNPATAFPLFGLPTPPSVADNLAPFESSVEAGKDIVSSQPEDEEYLPPPPLLTKSHSEPKAREPPEPMSPLEPGRPLKVLVVDDDELTRTLMTRMLSKLGCQVQTANDGQQFLDALLGWGPPDDPQATPPQYFDLVSLDNAMPVMTGQQAIKTLRALGRNDFVVGITGNALKTDQATYFKAGADDVLAKPIMMKNLKAVLDIALQRRSEMEA